MMVRELYILGASGHGKVVSDIAKSMKKYQGIHFFDDAAGIAEGNMEALIQQAKNNLAAEAIVAVGDNAIRKKLQSRIEQENIPIATLVHASAVISDEAKIGAGTVVMPGAVVNSGAMVGKGCIINTSSSVDHDGLVGDYCHIAVGSHLAGAVRVGGGTLVGAGAIIKNNTAVCGECLIGAGAVVVDDIEFPGTYMGVPARLKKSGME